MYRCMNIVNRSGSLERWTPGLLMTGGNLGLATTKMWWPQGNLTSLRSCFSLSAKFLARMVWWRSPSIGFFTSLMETGWPACHWKYWTPGEFQVLPGSLADLSRTSRSRIQVPVPDDKREPVVDEPEKNQRHPLPDGAPLVIQQCRGLQVPPELCAVYAVHSASLVD